MFQHRGGWERKVSPTGGGTKKRIKSLSQLNVIDWSFQLIGSFRLGHSQLYLLLRSICATRRRLSLHEEQRTTVGIKKNRNVLQDFVAQRFDVEFIANVLDLDGASKKLIKIKRWRLLATSLTNSKIISFSSKCFSSFRDSRCVRLILLVVPFWFCTEPIMESLCELMLRKVGVPSMVLTIGFSRPPRSNSCAEIFLHDGCGWKSNFHNIFLKLINLNLPDGCGGARSTPRRTLLLIDVGGRGDEHHVGADERGGWRMGHQPRVDHVTRRLPDEIVLRELLVLVQPRFHPHKFAIEVVGDGWPVVVEPQGCAPLGVGGHSALGLLDASQMQSWKKGDWRLI